MKQYTHVLTSLGLSSLWISIMSCFFQLSFFLVLFPFYFILIAWIPDYLDHHLYKEHQRRFLTHSPLSPLLIVISLSSGLLFSILNWLVGISLGILTHVIFILHFLLDFINPSGVPITPRMRATGGTIRYDNLSWNLLFSMAGAGLVAGSIGIFVLFGKI